MSFDWLTWLIYALVIALVVMQIYMSIKGLYPFKKKSAMERNRSIEAMIYKDLYISCVKNRSKRIKYVRMDPSKIFLPKILGKYKGHIGDKRLLVLAISTSKIPFTKKMLLLIPYSVKGEQLVYPLTTKNITLKIDGVTKFGYFYIPCARADSSIMQEDIEVIAQAWLNTLAVNKYGIEQLPAQTILSPTEAAAVSEKIERKVIWEKEPTMQGGREIEKEE